MADGVDDSPGGDLWDEVHHPAPFGSSRDHPYRDHVFWALRVHILGPITSFEIIKCLGLYQNIDIMNPVLGGAQKRTLAVSSERFGSVLSVSQVPRRTKIRQGLRRIC